MKIALIPIDNRPVCYNLPKEIAEIDDELELFLPDRKHLGGLFSYANVDELFRWVDSLPELDALVISLDTIAYGGLISSRRIPDSLEDIKARLDLFKGKLKNKGKVYAFSSIMRISNNNVNEEEKEYWSEYGTKIFEYSYNFHKECLDETNVPQEIIHDYLATRRRNFEINKMYLEWLEQGLFSTLAFSKDDCAQYGLNVLEADILDQIIKDKKLSACVKTGADEIPLTLFARAIVDFNKNCGNMAPKISAKFFAPEDKDLISNYEDISIEKSVFAQIDLTGCKISEENESDLILLVNNFEELQGEIVMERKTKPYKEKLELPEKPFMIADVRFANGSDNVFVQKLLRIFEKNGIKIGDFFGYSAWNTSANTLGSLLCAAIVKFFAKKYNDEAFRKLQLIRFLDDWAYQANVRQELKQKINGKKDTRPDVRKLKKAMKPYKTKLKKLFKVDLRIRYKFPWRRFFEVEIVTSPKQNIVLNILDHLAGR